MRNSWMLEQRNHWNSSCWLTALLPDLCRADSSSGSLLGCHFLKHLSVTFTPCPPLRPLKLFPMQSICLCPLFPPKCKCGASPDFGWSLAVMSQPLKQHRHTLGAQQICAKWLPHDQMTLVLFYFCFSSNVYLIGMELVYDNHNICLKKKTSANLISNSIWNA